MQGRQAAECFQDMPGAVLQLLQGQQGTAGSTGSGAQHGGGALARCSPACFVIDVWQQLRVQTVTGVSKRLAWSALAGRGCLCAWGACSGLCE